MMLTEEKCNDIDNNITDISSRNDYPSANLSNFTPHSFTYDSVVCASMEGFLQSLKFNNPDTQITVCQLFGGHAKKKGSRKNKLWKKSQTLYWKGVPIDRHSEEYQLLLDGAFDALSTNEDFKRALMDTGETILTHSMGKDNKYETILTTEEFCGRLMKIRNKLNLSK